MSAPESANEPQTGSLARTISTNVAQLMDERRVNQAQLAEAIGMLQSGVSKRLKGTTNWTADDIEAVSIAFDVPVARLIEPAPEAPARPLRVVTHARHPRSGPVRQAAGHTRTADANLRESDTVGYPRRNRRTTSRTALRTRSDVWRIKGERGSHELPSLLVRHASNPVRCQRVAA